MVKSQRATLRFARPLPPYWAVRFDLPHPPAAGNFVLADLGEPLRVPLFPAEIDGEGFVALLPPGHPATRLLPGSPVDLLGPLGSGFRVGEAARLLLVAEVRALPPLLPLLEAAPAVALVIEAQTRVQLPPPTRFPPAVELHLLTADGSAGRQGRLDGEGSPLPDLIAWAERLCLACDPARYPELARYVRSACRAASPAPPGSGFAQALVAVPMPCGVGACEICRVETRRGEQRACSDGPVFDLFDFGG